VLLGTYKVGSDPDVFYDPFGLAFDGVKLWIANSGNNSVSVR
jgi:hypothetical protein